ncbi:MAG: glycosyltransferase family 9 protein [Cyclobacteriaceae bacterium]|nr:glycosyltransferase family 9 protein [Cyclobacteriaceae bacterium]
MNPRKLLVIQTAFLGDVVLATALIESLHARFPDAKIDFMVRNGNEGLLLGHPILRHVLVLNKRRKLHGIWTMVQRLRREKYDVVVNVQRFFRTGLITALSGARHTIGFSQNPMSLIFSVRVPHSIGSLHEVERNHRLIASLTGTETAGKPRLYPTEKQRDKAAKVSTGSFVTLSPASVWMTKQLPEAQWISLAKAIPLHLQVLLLGGPGDIELCQSIAQQCGRDHVKVLAGELSLLESAAVMGGAVMNYVNDSGPMHLASALNAPVTAVFCSTVPAFGFGPLSEQSFIVETTEKLSCRPCGLHGKRACPQGHFKCATTIRTDQLIATLAQ